MTFFSKPEIGTLGLAEINHNSCCVPQGTFAAVLSHLCCSWSTQPRVSSRNGFSVAQVCPAQPFLFPTDSGRERDGLMWWQLAHVPFHSLSPPSHLPLSHPSHTLPHAHISFVGQSVLKCRPSDATASSCTSPPAPVDRTPGLVSEAGGVRSSTIVACPLSLPQTLRGSLASMSYLLGLSFI